MGRGGYLGGCTVVGWRSNWLGAPRRPGEPLGYPSAKAAQAIARLEIERLCQLIKKRGGAEQPSGSARGSDRPAGSVEKLAPLRRRLQEAKRRRHEFEKTNERSAFWRAKQLERELMDEHIRDLTALLRQLEG
jgi:hypothetical protein